MTKVCDDKCLKIYLSMVLEERDLGIVWVFCEEKIFRKNIYFVERKVLSIRLGNRLKDHEILLVENNKILCFMTNRFNTHNFIENQAKLEFTDDSESGNSNFARISIKLCLLKRSVMKHKICCMIPGIFFQISRKWKLEKTFPLCNPSQKWRNYLRMVRLVSSRAFQSWANIQDWIAWFNKNFHGSQTKKFFEDFTNYFESSIFYYS